MADEKTIVGTLLGAALAIGGYFAKALADWWKKKRNERARTVAQLERLKSLLHASGAIFLIQRERAETLTTSLAAKHREALVGAQGFEEILTRCYPLMTEEELTLHAVIRAYTEHSLKSVNDAVSDWLKNDSVFKSAIAPVGRRRQLASELFTLEVHLLLWHAKFQAWVPNHPEHALVYLNDEKEHGLGFPVKREVLLKARKVELLGVETEIAMALTELRDQWSPQSRSTERHTE